jgi:predicted RNA polymerase sigma factor
MGRQSRAVDAIMNRQLDRISQSPLVEVNRAVSVAPLPRMPNPDEHVVTVGDRRGEAQKRTFADTAYLALRPTMAAQSMRG